MKISSNTLIVVLLAVAASCALISCDNGKVASTETSTTTDTVAVPDTITLAMTGDVMMGSLYPHERLPADSGAHIFDDVTPILRSADVTLGNFEGTFAYSGKNRKNPASPMAFMFMMPPHFVHLLTDAGYDFMGLANNHIYDFWEAAMTTTEETLEKAGIGYAGAKDPTGRTQHQEYCVKEIDGVRYGFTAFGHEDYSLRTQDTATVRRIITTLRKMSDIVIVSFHGGAEGSGARHIPFATEYLQGDDRGNVYEFGHFCIDVGADVVYGHGPHVVRAIEMYKGKFIAYSLGNFCTCGMGVAGLTGYAPIITIRINDKGELIDGQIHSFLQEPMRGPKVDKSCRVAKEIKTLTQEDIPNSQLNISDDGVITRR